MAQAQALLVHRFADGSQLYFNSVELAVAFLIVLAEQLTKHADRHMISERAAQVSKQTADEQAESAIDVPSISRELMLMMKTRHTTSNAPSSSSASISGTHPEYVSVRSDTPCDALCCHGGCDSGGFEAKAAAEAKAAEEATPVVEVRKAASAKAATEATAAVEAKGAAEVKASADAKAAVEAKAADDARKCEEVLAKVAVEPQSCAGGAHDGHS